ncbi:MAG TPA: hypothetical protein VM347_18700 [Nonomuraea sp.]|nr:hypothetical protein [Nonomuraea sp.]
MIARANRVGVRRHPPPGQLALLRRSPVVQPQHAGMRDRPQQRVREIVRRPQIVAHPPLGQPAAEPTRSSASPPS